jgi:hypothetical protein
MSRVFEFFFVIRRSVIVDARNYIAAKELMQQEQNNLDEVLIEDDTDSLSDNNKEK